MINRTSCAASKQIHVLVGIDQWTTCRHEMAMLSVDYPGQASLGLGKVQLLQYAVCIVWHTCQGRGQVQASCIAGALPC